MTKPISAKQLHFLQLEYPRRRFYKVSFNDGIRKEDYSRVVLAEDGLDAMTRIVDLHQQPRYIKEHWRFTGVKELPRSKKND
jgi:hypothetical protein